MKHVAGIAMVLSLLGCLPARAGVLIQVDQSSERMKVSVDGVPTYDWRVSTGRPGYETPNGSFRPNRMDADHKSNEYDGAPMPYAIFFDLKGHAIHGSYDKIKSPGASHGCVRLTPAHAKQLFSLVQQAGMSQVSVRIGGDVRVAMGKTPRRSRLAERRVRRQQAAQVYEDAQAPMQIYPPDLVQDDRGYVYRQVPYQGW